MSLVFVAVVVIAIATIITIASIGITTSGKRLGKSAK